MNFLLEEWKGRDLKLIDIEGKPVSLTYKQVKNFQQYKELVTEKCCGSEMVLPTGQTLKLIHIETASGKFKIPRQADNDKAILDFILTRPN
ncbi:MAG: hypothetical protein GY710_17360 [Desulfobacteraceae bacterium]|nr:hypothetical protein [Desulfobacteraceae bacterium]